MPEAVIVATARTPIGRAFKGSFAEERADDMAAFIVDAALKKVPELDRNTVNDLMLGCGLPGGEQGFNMGRVVAILAGMPTVPGCTITRYCSSSLQTIRMASHAIKAGEGDVYIAAGGPHARYPEPQVRRPGRAVRGAHCGRSGNVDASDGPA
jgi:acetyl-CoA C-acetyltransferase